MSSVARWKIELNCECPKCGEYVDLLEYSDFWEDQFIKEIPIRGNIETTCPNCKEYIECVGEY